MLLVLSAPSKLDSYYKRHFDGMIEFYISYANAVKEYDNVVVLADKNTMPYLKSRLPKENLLLIEEQLDPWVRDVSPVCPGKNVQFLYSGGLKNKEAKRLQKSFNKVIGGFGIEFEKVDFCNDGGNFIYNDKQNIIVTTDKFLELNDLSKSEATEILKDIFRAKKVAVVPADDEKLGHIDGMCAFLPNDTMLLVNYDDDQKFRRSVLTELERLDIKIQEVDCAFSDKKAHGGFASSYGIYVNCVLTENAVYVPIFNHKLDAEALERIKEIVGDNIKVVPVDATSVCHLGGSLRCLSWEVEGENAAKMIHAAKTLPPH